LHWLGDFTRVLEIAGLDTEEPVVLEHDKPQTFLIEFRFGEVIEEKSLQHVRALLLGFAESNSGHVLVLDIDSRGLRFVLMMERMYNATLMNPLIDQPTPQKKKRRAR